MGTLLLVTNIMISSVVLADDCAHIGDLDDRAECYAKEKEKKEKEYSSISKTLERIKAQKEELSQEVAGLASKINVTQAEINKLQAKINDLDTAINSLDTALNQRKDTLNQKQKLRDTAIRNLAKNNLFNGWEGFFGGLGKIEPDTDITGFELLTFNYLFDNALTQEAYQWIETLTGEIKKYEQDKRDTLKLREDVKREQENLLAVQQKLTAQKNKVWSEEQQLDAEQAEKTQKLLSLQEEIAKLSAKQQEVLNLKSGSGNVSGYEAPEYHLPDPPFKPAFAAMSYGAFTHYKGMSQYGAKGRAEDGQDYKEILKFYYKTDVKKKDDFPDKICVEGYGKMDFQRYLYGIAEMPSTWPKEALKAQAVAARTYAYRYVKAGKCICTTENCQVFSKSKSDNPPDRWKDAVKDTKNKILDGDVVAYYSSTTGGYVEPAGWDLDGHDWPDDAYEKKAKSPWFYKAWYTQTYNSNSSTCGRSTPWLKEKEMVDILNAWVVWRKGSDSEKRHISPITTSCWGGDPYSMDKMAEKADKYGSKFKSVSKVYTPSFSSGQTTKICFETNRGKTCIAGDEFKTVFNLRAPGYIAIRSRLFDIEMEK